MDLREAKFNAASIGHCQGDELLKKIAGELMEEIGQN
jgi:hypothetical protein